METIVNMLKGLVFWTFLISFSLGIYLGSQGTSYLSYNETQHIIFDKSAQYLKSPEYKYSYRDNIFYKLDRLLYPSEFKDVRHLEKAEKIESIKQEEKTYNDQLIREQLRNIRSEYSSMPENKIAELAKTLKISDNDFALGHTTRLEYVISYYQDGI